MLSGGVLKDQSAPRVVPSLVKEPTEEEKAEFAALEVLDLDIEQAEYLQTIGEGWAFPLKRFMNELELLEVMHMRTLTDSSTGERHLLSVPITHHVTAEDKERLTGKEKVALKCTAISNEVLAVIEGPCFFNNRKEEISTRVFGTSSTKHPKVERIMA